MAVEITARHMHAAEGALEHARNKGEALAAEFRRIEHVHVILDIQKHLNIARISVLAKGPLRLEADETSEDMYTSIDVAVEKVAKQLRKIQEKVHDHKNAMKHSEHDLERGEAP